MNERIAAALAVVSLDGLVACDRHRRYVFWNPAMEQMTGISPVEVIDRRITDVAPFLREDGLGDRIDDALRGLSAVARDRRFIVPETGRDGWFDAHYAPLRDDDGAIVGATVIVRDISERKLAEARIAETERRFQNMADASPVLLWMAGADSLCTFFNHTWLHFTGRTLREEWGIGWAEGVHFEDLQRCMDTYETAFSARRAFEMEYRLRRSDGEYRWVLDRGAPRYEPDGTFAGYIGSCIDITDRLALETELRARLRLRDEFLSIASHELRTPLTALRLQVDGMIRHEERGTVLGPDERTRRWRTMQSSLDRLERLVSRFLDVSRMRSGGPQLEPSPFDLVELVRQVCDRLGDELTRAGSVVDIEADAPVQGTWDRERLEQVVVNLVSNAGKYGGGKPVHVRVERHDGSARVVVRDHGIGIPEGEQHRIFDRFERAVSARSFGGFGLGLWIANEIVKASGGRIDVESTPGQGSTFTVTLPRDR